MRKNLLIMAILPLMLFASFSFSKKSPSPLKGLEVITLAYAQDEQAEAPVQVEAPKVSTLPSAPEGDPAVTLVKLITDWKASSPIALGALIILFLIQLLKSEFLGQFFKSLEWKRLFITILGIAYGVIYLISTGVNWVTALVIGLLSSGGAVAIYNALEPLLKKKKA